MGFGISKTLNKLLIKKNVFEFSLRRKILGFENANTLLRIVDKNSVIPILKSNGAKIGDNVDIEAPLFFHNCTDFSKLEIGSNCHIGKNCFFDLRGKITIGNNVVISMLSTFITHIDMTKSNLSSLFPATSGEIKIGDNCYIGVGSTILMGVEIKANSFIAARALVTKDVDQFTMVGGVPAKEIKKIELKS